MWNTISRWAWSSSPVSNTQPDSPLHDPTSQVSQPAMQAQDTSEPTVPEQSFATQDLCNSPVREQRVQDSSPQSRRSPRFKQTLPEGPLCCRCLWLRVRGALAGGPADDISDEPTVKDDKRTKLRTPEEIVTARYYRDKGQHTITILYLLVAHA